MHFYNDATFDAFELPRHKQPAPAAPTDGARLIRELRGLFLFTFNRIGEIEPQLVAEFDSLLALARQSTTEQVVRAASIGLMTGLLAALDITKLQLTGGNDRG